MKYKGPLFFSMGLLSLLSGYLLSRASLAGKFGISIFYQDYSFLKSWWKAAAVVLLVQLFLMILLEIIKKRSSPRGLKIASAFVIILALIGIYFSYYDFKTTMSHRLLGKRFHQGVYLFWISWVVMGCFYLRQEKLEEMKI